MLFLLISLVHAFVVQSNQEQGLDRLTRQTSKHINPFPNNSSKLKGFADDYLKSDANDRKFSVWVENVRKLITSNFPFSHSVFKKPVLHPLKNQGLFRKGLTSLNGILVISCGPCTYPCFHGVLLISSPNNILSKALAAFQHNHCRNNGQR